MAGSGCWGAEWVGGCVEEEVFFGNGIGQDWPRQRGLLNLADSTWSPWCPKQKQMTQTGHHRDSYEIHMWSDITGRESAPNYKNVCPHFIDHLPCLHGSASVSVLFQNLSLLHHFTLHIMASVPHLHARQVFATAGIPGESAAKMMEHSARPRTEGLRVCF